jgi:hypothetical protein
VTPTGAYLCNSHGFTITSKTKEISGIRPPNQEKALPYAYFKGKKKPTLQFDELPSAKVVEAALEALEAGGSLPKPAEAVDGAFFVARDREVSVGESTFYKTVAGHFVRAEDMKKVTASSLRGELLSKDGTQLPLAFVHKESVPILCNLESERTCGVAVKHARFHVVREIKREKKRYVLGPDEALIERDNVRVARAIKPPSKVGSGDRWVHFDLSDQVMVAYQGDRPVFASLVSTGKKGRSTPTGTFRIYLKYISSRMSGDDAKDGPYDIGEVPWVMYYHHGFAVHGAYWHDVFGNVRSHGCTNLAPADARWLYFFTEPQLPPGWHGRYSSRGTYFHFTN